MLALICKVMAVDGEGGGQRGEHALGEQGGAGAVRNARLDDRKLVAAESRQSVAVAHAGPQPLRHRHQEPVAGEVAKAVIDGLEVVQIEVVQRDHLALPLPAAQRLIQPVIVQPAVRQIGEGIVMRQVPDAVARGGRIGEQAADVPGLVQQQPDEDAAADQDAEQIAELLQVQPALDGRAAPRSSGRPCS